jgi:Tol biopolymer transport system component
MVGTVLGHFRILAKLGEGGMGEVYLAEDTRLGRKVALKLLPEEITRNRDRKGRFEREARAVAALNHPHIVTVHSIEEIDGRTVLVLELVRGRTLADAIPRGGYNLSRFLDIALPLTEAVAAAHRQGVIHRDLKPGNVMLDEDGQVKVLDFGLARIEEGSSADGPTATATASRLVTTEEGKILGTVAYMSPEQLEGRPVDRRTDIFSLGILLYEMSTGRRPFEGESKASVISSILRDDPPSVTELKADLPKQLARILRLCLAKDPERRYQTALDVRNELALLKEETESGEVEIPAPVRGRRSRSSRLVITAGLPLVVALGVLGSFWMRERLQAATPEPRTAAYGESVKGTVRRLTYSGHAAIGIWSPTSDEIAYTEGDGSGSRVMVVSATGGAPRVLHESASGFAWNWAPDGKAILGMSFIGGNWGSIRIDRYGDPMRVLCENSLHPDLSPDGRTLAYHLRFAPESTGVWTLDLDSGKKRLVVGPSPPGKNFYKPQWSPEGDRIAFSKWTGTGHEIWIHELATGEDRKLETGRVQVGGHYDWTSDGQFIATAGAIRGVWSMWMVPIDGGSPVPLTQGGTGAQERHASVSPDNLAVVFTRYADASRIATLDLETGDPGRPFDLDLAVRYPCYEPDGDRILFQAVVEGRWQIWSAGVGDGSHPHPFLPVGGWSFQPTVLPDGSVLHLRAEERPLAVHGALEWAQTLWLSSADGGRHRPLESAGDRLYRISPGGFHTDRWLYSTIDATGSWETIWLLRDGQEPEALWEDRDGEYMSAFDWGPSSREILLAHNVDGEVECTRISALDVETRELREIVDLEEALAARVAVESVAMGPARERVAIVSQVAREGSDEVVELLLLDIARASVSRIHVFERGEDPEAVRWSPDGRKVIFHLLQRESDVYVWEAPERIGT